MSTDIQKSESLLNKMEVLTTSERAAYQLSVSRREPFLSPSLAEQMFNLFRDGKTCDEIYAVNKGLTLGSIVRARIDHDWDQRRLQYVDGLLVKARAMAQQTHLEALAHLSSFLSAMNKADQAKLLRFIQTGDEQELKGALIIHPQSLRMYKDVLELVLKLGGTEQTPIKKTENKIIHSIESPGPVPAAAQPLTPDQAAALLLTIGVKKD